MGSPSRPAPAARPPKPISRIGTRAVALPHARARPSQAPGRVLGAPIPPLTAAAEAVGEIPKAPAVPAFGSLLGGKAAIKEAPKGPLLMPIPVKEAPKARAPIQPASPLPAPSEGLDPTVLLVGAGEKFTPAFQAALARHRVFVEVANPDAVLEAAVTTAPDLVLLMGDAARDCGSDLLAKLAALPRNFSVPVVILEDATELDSKLRAFRSGATAIIPRSASVDATAEQVAKLARQIPEQGTEHVGMLGEATLEDFVSALSKQLRSELVSVVSPEGKDGDPVRLVLGRGRPLAEFMDLFVRRVRRHVLLAEPLHYELGEGTAAGVAGSESVRPRIAPRSITNLRVILADDDTPRADSVAQELRNRGATVIVTDLDPTEPRFERLRQVDPAVLMIGESHVHGTGRSLLRRMRQDTRLRWASQLVVRWDEVWSDRTGELGIQRFESTLAGLSEPEVSLRDRAEVKAPFDTRLEIIGPARILRALASTGHAIRVSVQNPRAEIRVDLSDGLVVGVEGRSLGDDPKEFEGANALSALLLLGSGRVHVESVDQPATANVMAPVDVALNMADAEAPPIAPSIPAAGAVSIHPPFQGGSIPDVEPTIAIPAMPRAPVIPIQAETSQESAQPPPEPFAPSPSAPEHSWVAEPVVPGRPASMVPAYSPDAATAPALNEAASPGWRRVLSNADAWYQAENAKVHAPRLSPRTAGLLLALAVAQGLGLVGIYAGLRALGRSEPAKVEAVEKPAVKPEPARAAAVASPSPAAPAEPLLPTVREPDGGGKSVEDCQTLLAQNPPQDGYYPGAAQEQSRIGRKAIVHGDLKEARAGYCRAVHWDGKNAEIALQLAQVFLLERDGGKALEYAEQAAALDPTQPRVQEVLGDSYARIGAYREARSAWFDAAKLESTSADATRRLVSREVRQADLALRRHDLVVAEKFFRRAAILEPASSASMIGLSYVLVQLEDVKGAAFWARRAVKVAPRNAAARLALGDALNAAKDQRAAIVEWREASLLDPSNAEAQKRLRRAGVPLR
jgi:tetratricopeptide (TPR) repeat protein/DNA-binding NarL/FixJ family response regulator